jgi:hypothetical protein
MRSIGVASRALDLLLQRVSDPARRTFGKYLREHGGFSFAVTPMVRSSSQGPCSRTSPILAPRSIKRGYSSSPQRGKLTCMGPKRL